MISFYKETPCIVRIDFEFLYWAHKSIGLFQQVHAFDRIGIESM